MTLETQMSLHATQRSQYRGVPQWVIDMILEYGRVSACRDEGNSFYLDKHSMTQIKMEAGKAAACTIEPFKNVYVITAGGAVVTVAFARRSISRSKRGLRS